MSVNFNPFDDSYLKLKSGQPNEIQGPEKIDDTKVSDNNRQDVQSIGATEKSNENELVDISSMTDDMDGFFNRKGQG